MKEIKQIDETTVTIDGVTYLKKIEKKREPIVAWCNIYSNGAKACFTSKNWADSDSKIIDQVKLIEEAPGAIQITITELRRAFDRAVVSKDIKEKLRGRFEDLCNELGFGGF